VAQIQAEIKRAILRQIAEGAKKTASTFKDALLGFQSAITDQPSFRRGKILVSTSGSGQSSSFQINAVGSQLSTENWVAMSEEFFDILDDTLGSFALTDDGSPGATDTILTAMKQDARLYGVTAAGLDVTLIGMPGGTNRYA
jgi:hypothetical protein